LLISKPLGMKYQWAKNNNNNNPLWIYTTEGMTAFLNLKNNNKLPKV